MDKKVVIVSAPSGSGKTTIIKHLLNSDLPLAFSISACTRTMRDGEIHGRDYYFLSPQEFVKQIEQGHFIEWEEVYEGLFYGTLTSEPERIWSEGKYVLFDVDVIGGLNIKKAFGEKALALFIMPPSMEELRHRLENRGTDTPEVIEKRIGKANREIGYSTAFDHVVINDNLSEAVKKTEALIRAFLQ